MRQLDATLGYEDVVLLQSHNDGKSYWFADHTEKSLPPVR